MSRAFSLYLHKTVIVQRKLQFCLCKSHVGFSLVFLIERNCTVLIEFVYPRPLTQQVIERRLPGFHLPLHGRPGARHR